MGPAQTYWQQQMDEAYNFMQRMLEYPLSECGERVVSLPELAAAHDIDMRFSARPHVGNRARIYYMRESVASDLMDAGRAMNERGWALRIEDAFRTKDIQAELSRADYVLQVVFERVVWEVGSPDPPAELIVKRLAGLCAAWPRVGTHMAASAVDVSVVERETGNEIDRGAPYLELSELTPMYSPFGPPQALRNRATITAMMNQFGFVAYPYEFWHYSKGDVYAQSLAHTGAPSRYGPVLIQADGAVEPLEAIASALNSPEDLLLELADVRAESQSRSLPEAPLRFADYERIYSEGMQSLRDLAHSTLDDTLPERPVAQDG